MAARSVTVVSVAGTASNPQTPTVSDTVHINDIGRGCVLEVVNASGGSITVTVLDGSRTPAGTPAVAATPVTVTASGRTRFLILPSYAASDGYVTINYSSTTSVTYDLYRTP